jgi:hypothetical protein
MVLSTALAIDQIFLIILGALLLGLAVARIVLLHRSGARTGGK